MKRALLGVLGALLIPAPAQAAIFNVNTTADSATCTTTCSLRGAWIAALNNGTAPDTINVPAGSYSPVGGLNSGAGTSPDGITIVGAGANSTSIQSAPINGVPTRVLTVGTLGTLGVTGVTIQGGNPGSVAGGNISVTGSGGSGTVSLTVTLTRVRVTGGTAANGGGIAISGSSANSQVNLVQSLVDGNTVTGTGANGNGGGVYVSGATNRATLAATDSTITANHATIGAGIDSESTSTVTLAGVTLARNVASGVLTGGGIHAGSGAGTTLQGSIIDGNTANSAAGLPVATADNCSFTTAAVDQGGNIDSGNNCGFTTSTQVNTNTQLASALDTTQEPPVLTIPAGSPAVDASACNGRLFDQRGVARPQGLRCDSGAYEYQAPVVVPPTPTPTATPVVTPSPTPSPVPVPTFNKTVVVEPVSGKVTIKVPGAKSFAPLNAGLGVPVGSTVDTRDGKVELTSIPKAGGKPETATFYDGIFKVTQSKGITNLTLTEALAACPKAGHASAAAKKPKTRRLWGSGKGNFRTTGKYSAATIRGTTWLVQDSCAGTTTTVKQGVVTVRDNVKHKTIIVKAPHHYLARPKK